MTKFDYFVVFAEMRTGSNLLEANINLIDGLSCHGEAFNPSFIGTPKSDSLLGVTLEQRVAEPSVLIAAIKRAPGLAGFRFFNDHDSRVLDICFPDPRCAKIILTRNPVESYVSWKIAQATGQWKLTNATHAKAEKITFNAFEFETYLQRLQAFQVRLLNALQYRGQTAFYLSYDDLGDVEVMNGLATFLGSDERIAALNRKLKKQNPAPLRDKVTNPDEMSQALAGLDRFSLDRTPNFEPRRGPMIPAYIAAPESGLLYLPLRSGLDGRIRTWLAALDDQKSAALQTGFSQKTLRQWKQDHSDHRSFTVLRHPVARAHNAFCKHILFEGPQLFPKIRQTLRKVHKLPIPAEPIRKRNLKGYDLEAHKAAFSAFVMFLQHNLSAQTAVRTDPAWASQLSVLQGMSQFGLPDLIAREERLDQDLAFLAKQVGHVKSPAIASDEDTEAALLDEVYDPDIEERVRDAYHRDYLAFGFEDWR